MIAPEPTRVTVKKLRRAGFAVRQGRGSHTVWTCPHGTVRVTVPTGHGEQSPGVVRAVAKALDKCMKEHDGQDI